MMTTSTHGTDTQPDDAGPNTLDLAPPTAWDTWEVVGAGKSLGCDDRFAAVLDGAGNAAPRRATATSWTALVDRLREVDPRTIRNALLLPPYRAMVGHDVQRWPPTVPADVRSTAELNRALDHLLDLHWRSNHAGDQRWPDTAWCAVCLDEPYPCFTVREVQAARRFAWRTRDIADHRGTWEPMTTEELALSLASYAAERRFWAEGIGDLPSRHHDPEQVERRKRPRTWSVTPPPRTHTPREQDVTVAPEPGAGPRCRTERLGHGADLARDQPRRGGD